MALEPPIQLTPSDNITLTRLFDPESSPSPNAHNTVTISPELPADPNFPSPVLQELQKTEHAAIILAEDSSTTEALSLLDQLIASNPLYASAYNNRAQLKRILSYPRIEIISDLDAAINHGLPDRTSSGSAISVSVLQAKVLSAAYTQQGAVLLESGEEDGAMRAFQEGAKYGGKVARVMAVRTNPYARLCGAIVKESMKKEMMLDSR
jgi:hypothetical protein